MDVRAILALLALFYLALLVRALPVSNNNNNNSKDKEKEVTKEEEKKIESELDDLGLEYGRYLQQVVEALEQDKDFAKKLENVSQEEIKNGAIARELNLVDHRVRNKLDELKRIEMDRLRALAKKEQRLNEGERAWRTLDTPIDADHVDHRNPHSFEAEDLQKLILQATKDLEALDAKRREDFKTYEMEKELRFREDLLNLTETEREARIKEHEQAKHVEHPKVHHPGSKKQLEQVWEEKDGLPAQEFDPKVFFQLHDVNSDGFLDPEEVEAILSVEVRKLYADAQHADQNEVQEEFHRMREHIYKEADANRDGLISKKEFLEFTRRMEFQQDEGWKGLDEQQVFSEEELKRFQQERALHPEEVLRREQMAAYQFQQQQQYNQYYQQQHPQQQHPQQHPNQQYQQYGQQHPNQQMQGFPHAPVQQYLPPPHQMSPQDWAHAQQQYYQQQLHAQQQIPNPQLHQQQQQQYQQHAQQQQQQFVQQAAHAQQQQPQYVQVEQMHAQAQQGQHVPVQQMPAHAQTGGGAQHVQQQPQQQQQVHVQQPQGAPLQQH